jgi:hypothetical protein
MGFGLKTSQMILFTPALALRLTKTLRASSESQTPGRIGAAIR